MIKAIGTTVNTASYNVRSKNQKPAFGFKLFGRKPANTVKEVEKTAEEIAASMKGKNGKVTIRSILSQANKSSITAAEQEKSVNVANNLLLNG